MWKSNNVIDHCFSSGSILLIFIFMLYSIMWIHCILSVDRHLDCFHYLAIKNNAAMHIHVQVLWGHVLNSFEYLPSSEMMSHDSFSHESPWPAFFFFNFTILYWFCQYIST